MLEFFNLILMLGFFFFILFWGLKRDVIGNLLGLFCFLGKFIDLMVIRRFLLMGKFLFEFNILVILDM